jgi:hypothetical protein
MSMRIVHRLAVKGCPALHWTLASFWEASVIPLTKVQVMIYVSIKAFWSVKPWTRANEYAPREPFRPIIPIRSTTVRWNLIVSIGTHRGSADGNGNLCGCTISRRPQNCDDRD